MADASDMFAFDMTPLILEVKSPVVVEKEVVSELIKLIAELDTPLTVLVKVLVVVDIVLVVAPPVAVLVASTTSPLAFTVKNFVVPTTAGDTEVKLVKRSPD